jgi:hypothetical protein
MIPAPALGQLNLDPSQPVPLEGDGAFLADLPAEAIDALLALAGPDADTPLSVSRSATWAARWPRGRRPSSRGSGR